MLELDYAADSGASDDPVGRAINHPTGHVAEALIRWWYRKQPKDAEKLAEPLRSLFSEACDLDNPKFKHFRVLLAAHVLPIFRVDPEWAREHLLPLFDWLTSTEAGPAWEGFLWSPRLYRPLMEAIGPYFLETARRYADLHDHAEQYASLLTFASLDRGDTFSVAELAAATAALPDEGLARSAESLARAVAGAGEDKAEFVRNRLRPYIHSIWPQDRARTSPEIAESFARMCIAAGPAFSDAFGLIGHWLVPFPHPDFAVHLLYESKLSTQFPAEALEFLDKIVGDVADWGPRELRQCLEQIAAASPPLMEAPSFLRLVDFSRRHG